ncbi:hypothetical protein [Corynebacterium diphtheriae]|uniref:phage major capsid protein n=1 Tax=Corynebacterium diphtheriae TaxID=1717 RepID=UPI0018CBD60B|nr:hypothetical protein [Corynebacterium diphtheriae]MBG9316434.1 hypothetical protein [Corynebacterium diphtheriae bv. mitis]
MTYTGAFGGGTITVDDMVKDPTYIQQNILEDLDGSFLEEAIFRNAGPNDGVIAYREAAAPFLNDGAEEVAEYAEIPLSDLEIGNVKSLVGHKSALGVSVSYETRRFNRIDPVNLQVTALKNTMVRSSVDAALFAFKKAKVQTLSIENPWDTKESAPLSDIRAAKRMVSQAKTDDGRNAKFGYKPDTIVISEAALDVALENEATQRMFNGNAALENPLYKGILPMTIAGLRVVTSSWLDEKDAYIMEAQRAGFYSDSIPLTVSELYSPSGNASHGGSTMSWRVDAFRQRIFAVDNPKAVVKLENFING